MSHTVLSRVVLTTEHIDVPHLSNALYYWTFKLFPGLFPSDKDYCHELLYAQTSPNLKIKLLVHFYVCKANACYGLGKAQCGENRVLWKRFCTFIGGVIGALAAGMEYLSTFIRALVNT